jgi:Holliday junction resolvase RusA-like endonuclease
MLSKSCLGSFILPLVLLNTVFEVEPQALQRVKFSFRRAYTPAKSVRAKRDLATLMHRSWLKPATEEPLGLQITFVFSRKKSVRRKLHTVRPDLDNLIKLVCDSGNKVIWKDDAQIFWMHVQKEYGDYPHIRFVVYGCS